MVTVVSIPKLFYKDNNLLIVKGKGEHASYDGNTLSEKINLRKGEAESLMDEGIMTESSTFLGKHKCLNNRSVNKSTQKGTDTNALSSTENHLKSLGSYLRKLHGDAKKPSSKILNQKIESVGKNDRPKADNGLRSLKNYLDKVKGGNNVIIKIICASHDSWVLLEELIKLTAFFLSFISDAEPEDYAKKYLKASTNTSTKIDLGKQRNKSFHNYMDWKYDDVEDKLKLEEDVSDFYIIGVLTSINIAVFLFEIATPVKNSEFELMSLPTVYGAKINTLILTGEWWRLVTPMFLHSGFFHISLGSWVLFTFGLQVSRQYGSFTFLLIYILGGISGNLISFLHTPEPTVGGTGPVFAIIGAWFIYQIQNKDVTATDASDRMFQNAIIVTALSFVLSNFAPIDEWAHFAAIFTGIAYGFPACPTLQVKDTSSEVGRRERLRLVRRYADPCKSLAFFSLFLFLLSSLLFFVEPPLDFSL